MGTQREGAGTQREGGGDPGWGDGDPEKGGQRPTAKGTRMAGRTAEGNPEGGGRGPLKLLTGGSQTQRQHLGLGLGTGTLTSLPILMAKVEEMGLWRKEQSGVPWRPGLSSNSSSRREVCGRAGRGLHGLHTRPPPSWRLPPADPCSLFPLFPFQLSHFSTPSPLGSCVPTSAHSF